MRVGAVVTPTPEEIARRILAPWTVGDEPLERLPGAPKIIANIAAAIRAERIEALEWAARAENECKQSCPRCGGDGMLSADYKEHPQSEWLSGSVPTRNCDSCDGSGEIHKDLGVLLQAEIERRRNEKD